MNVTSQISDRRFQISDRHSAGFTLVELLMVIVIIGILAGLITVAALRARIAALNAAMKMEIMSMDQAMNAFKEAFGEYPPDNSTAAKAFLARAFPRYGGDLPAGTTLNPSTALVVWLQGPSGTGFSRNPANPFDGNASRIGPFFTFDAARLNGGAYYPNNGIAATSASAIPYVYFAAQNGSYSGSTPTCGAKPYTGVNPYGIQILCPGLDGKYGAGTDYPTGSNYDSNQYDDITNFTTKAKIEDDMKQ